MEALKVGQWAWRELFNREAWKEAKRRADLRGRVTRLVAREKLRL